MDFGNFEFPCSLDINVYKAYFNVESLKGSKPLKSKSSIQAFDINWNALQPKTLRKLALDCIVGNWIEIPYFQEIPKQSDKNYILNNLDMSVPLKVSSAHIKDDFFWKKSFQFRWKTLPVSIEYRPWINVYMEKHLQEYIEHVEVCDYDQESAQAVLEICAPYINRLQIDSLQPSMGDNNDHVPLDFILSSLPDLRSLRATYCTKTIGTNFYLGCSSFSRRDILTFTHGLSRCYELTEFWLHSVKLDPSYLAYISRSLDKGCHHLTTLAITHCTMRDDGLQQFIEGCNSESFATLRVLDLTDNDITPEGAYILSRVIRGRSLEKLILRLNPIESDGAAAIFSVIEQLNLKELDLSGCSITDSILKLMMQLIIQSTTLLNFDISNNQLGEDLGQKVYQIVGFNKVMSRLDLRNTGVPTETRNKINVILKKNKRCFS